MEADKQLENDTQRNWENMDENILLKIFTGLNMVDLIIRVSGVCRSWCKLSHDPCLWQTLDMNIIMDSFLMPNNHDYVSPAFMQNLRSALVHSRGNFASLICTTFLDLDVASWVFIAESTPMLKRLVLPLPGQLTLSGFSETVKRWHLSLSISGVRQSKVLLEAVGKQCVNFSGLKLMSIFDKGFANSVVTFVPIEGPESPRFSCSQGSFGHRS